MAIRDVARTRGRSLARQGLAPLYRRWEALQAEVEALRAGQAALSARVEQIGRAQDRLDAYFDRFREELRAEFGSVVDTAVGARAVVEELVEPGSEGQAGLALRHQLDHAVRRAEDEVRAAQLDLGRSIGELRSSVRLTQALVERLTAGGAGGSAAADAAPDRSPEADAAVLGAPAPTTAAGPAPVPFVHPVPGLDLLYRTFEDRHRGEPELIRRRQSEDYLELLGSLPRADLPIADLGCGRGELVEILIGAGHRAVGVDSNLGQLVEGDGEHYVQDDLFRWLDAQEDGSLRAVISMHVVEHLPSDLQVRLVFEARRVLAEGGVLVLETPNTLSLSVAATNFWVDPTHERPVHPLFLQFLAEEAGFVHTEIQLLHPLPVSFPAPAGSEDLVGDLNSLIFGSGDLALIARR